MFSENFGESPVPTEICENTDTQTRHFNIQLPLKHYRFIAIHI